MIELITKGIDTVIKEIKKEQKQITFASAVALTKTAQLSVAELKKRAIKDLDNPTPFTLKGFRFTSATKRNLEARVYIAPIQAAYMQWQVYGGVRPKRAKKGELIPINIPLNKYGNVVGRRGGKINKLLARKDTFIDTINGVYGIWQRLYTSKAGRISAAGNSEKRNEASKKLKLLALLKPTVQYKPKFNFDKIVNGTLEKEFEKEFDKALSNARATAR